MPYELISMVDFVNRCHERDTRFSKFNRFKTTSLINIMNAVRAYNAALRAGNERNRDRAINTIVQGINNLPENKWEKYKYMLKPLVIEAVLIKPLKEIMNPILSSRTIEVDEFKDKTTMNQEMMRLVKEKDFSSGVKSYDRLEEERRERMRIQYLREKGIEVPKKVKKIVRTDTRVPRAETPLQKWQREAKIFYEDQDFHLRCDHCARVAYHMMTVTNRTAGVKKVEAARNGLNLHWYVVINRHPDAKRQSVVTIRRDKASYAHRFKGRTCFIIDIWGAASLEEDNCVWFPARQVFSTESRDLDLFHTKRFR